METYAISAYTSTGTCSIYSINIDLRPKANFIMEIRVL